MFIYGKTASNAIAIMSYLAANPTRRSGSAEIAKARNISKTLTAKLLTQLASAGLATGQPGPGGGYVIGKPPASICLLDIIELFEQTSAISVCPCGQGWCGKGEPCQLHDILTGMMENNRMFLEKTKLDVFSDNPKKATGKNPACPKTKNPLASSLR